MISVLLPSRGRTESLIRTVTSLRELAENPTEVEVLVHADDDDVETITTAHQLDCAIFSGPRLGYSQLHLYYNRLAATAAGEWLLLWNDDAFMQTYAWDSVIEAQPHPSVLNLKANHPPNLCCFPAVSKELTDAWGHFSLSPHCDSWVHEVAMASGVFRNVPIEVLHERFDLTGKHNDATYREGQVGYRSEEFGSPLMRAGRDVDAEIARRMARG